LTREVLRAVQAAVDVVHRDEDEHRAAQRRQPGRLEAEVAHQRHAGIDAFRLAGMDAVVVEEDRPALLLDAGTVEHAVGADHAFMHGQARVGLAGPREAQHLRKRSASMV
jgi:hypothetical protein